MGFSDHELVPLQSSWGLWLDFNDPFNISSVSEGLSGIRQSTVVVSGVWWPLVHLLLCQISQGGLPLTPKWFLWSLETLSWSFMGFDWLFKSPEGVSAAFEEIPNIIRKNLIDDRPRQECMWSKTWFSCYIIINSLWRINIIWLFSSHMLDVT